jgi:hypothetical protein
MLCTTRVFIGPRRAALHAEAFDLDERTLTLPFWKPTTRYHCSPLGPEKGGENPDALGLRFNCKNRSLLYELTAKIAP